MDISNLKQASVQAGNQSNNTVDILEGLRRLGGADATVVRVDKGEVLLATRLGEIIGKNVLDLKAGEQLRIRVGGQKSNPVLKISSAPTKRIILNVSRQMALAQVLAPNQAQTAMVATQNSASTGFELNGRQYSVSPQPGLKSGQLVSLIYRPDKGQIEINPVKPERILKSALVRMLPQAMQAGSSESLVSLIKTLQSLLPGSPAADSKIQFIPMAPRPGPESKPPGSVGQKFNPPGEPGLQNAAQLNRGEAETRLVSQILALLRSLPKTSTLDKATIQRWAEYSGPIKNAHSSGLPIQENPYALLKQLPTDEAGLRPLLAQLASQLSTSLPVKNQPVSTADLPGNESYSNLTRDILKLVEQSLTQYQFQQTNVRYQQEQQQPINLSVTIPVTEDQSTRPLHVEIRERKSTAENADNSWDINLSFEFDSLGLISSHIMLDGNTLSTTFWASEEDTKVKIDRALPEFKQQLVVSGFELGQFFSLAGPAPAIPEQERSFYPDTLLDIRV